MGGRSGQKLKPPIPPKEYDFSKITLKFDGVNAENLSQSDTEKYMRVSGVPFDFKGTITIISSEVSDSVVILSASESLLDADFNTIQTLTLLRAFYQDNTISNLNFMITKNKGKDYPYKYNGLNIFSQQVQEARKYGFKKITTSASGSKDSYTNGYYTWLRFGYKPDFAKDVLSDYKKNAGLSNALNVKNVTELMKTKEGQISWNKYGTHFIGEFDLSDNSYSMKTLNNYRKSKGLPKIK